MKALTLWQPWAQLVAIGAKKIETRSWATKYRGPIAIHAAQHKDTPRCVWEEPFKSELTKAGMMTEYPGGKFGFSLRYNGCVIAIADLVDCAEIKLDKKTGITALWIPHPIRESLSRDGYWYKEQQIFSLIPMFPEEYSNELAFGDYTPGRYAWILENVRRIEPIPAKGMQKLWEWEPTEEINVITKGELK